MISKIAGAQDFIKHTEQKQKISFFEQLNNQKNKIISSQKTTKSNFYQKEQETPADVFIRQKSSSDIKRERLFITEEKPS